MGTKLSTGIEDAYHPKIAPRTDRPPTFDPLYGFPNGRKERVMKITDEEMDRWDLAPGLRDYCAHLLVPFLRCQRASAPFAGHMCADIRHKYDQCEYQDYLIRMKEYEREKRLLKRKLRKEQAAGISE
ncbi:NADH dehydrogenase 1 beta subcomplex subunit 7 [Aphelenchoides avenae]|nr:NADH dehydrogenase 1 beta subcomplex subunit 7 [Aphelenchus avenae]KAH7721981.1 NADH dehydrogenase 1 beta subcomplex subunit 7 [Aphelenchus avenae]